MRALFPALPPILLALAGCAGADAGTYPSLAPRAIEQRSDAEPEVVTPVAAPDPALDGRIAETDKQTDAALASFDTAAKRVEARLPAARAGGVGSDAWVDTQTAISELLPFREAVAGAVADLEQWALDRAAAGEPAYPGLEAAKQRVGAAADAQRARYEALVAALPAP